MQVQYKINQGFTLLELMVVISLMAAIAGVAVLAYEDTYVQAELDATKYEMAELRKALLQFKRDVGSFPNDLLQLGIYSASAVTANGDSYLKWDKDTHGGWNGPYLNDANDGWVKISDTCQVATDDGAACTPFSGTITEIKTLADEFNHSPRDFNITPNDPGDDFFLWRACTDNGDVACKVRESWGQPYLYFDANDENYARIVSMGPDGIFNSKDNAVDPVKKCIPQNDDIVVCLK
jgi:prepilin-type N-terminal cleavage/methylation domain-containing protein